MLRSVYVQYERLSAVQRGTGMGDRWVAEEERVLERVFPAARGSKIIVESESQAEWNVAYVDRASASTATCMGAGAATVLNPSLCNPTLEPQFWLNTTKS
jgi:hypothetical protein